MNGAIRLHYACSCGRFSTRTADSAEPDDWIRCSCGAQLRPHFRERAAEPADSGAAAVGIVVIAAIVIALLSAVAALWLRWPAVLSWGGL